MGHWKFLSGAASNAYPVLCADYLKLIFPAFTAGLWQDITILVFNLLLATLKYTGLTVVSYTAFILGVVSLLPFLLMFFLALPDIRPSRWADLGQRGVDKDWPTFFNTLFWNLNFWDNASTLTGEIDLPQTTFPVALLAARVLTYAAYIVPLLACTGAPRVDQRRWEDGSFMRLNIWSLILVLEHEVEVLLKMVLIIFKSLALLKQIKPSINQVEGFPSWVSNYKNRKLLEGPWH